MPGSRASAGATQAPAKSASAPTLEALANAKLKRSFNADFTITKISTRDKEELKSFAHRRSRKVLRVLSYPDMPTGGGQRRLASLGVSSSIKPMDEKAAVAITKNPLEFALGTGPEAEAARNFIFEARRPLAEDDATAIYRECASLDWLDEEKLSAELAAIRYDALDDQVESAKTDVAPSSSIEQTQVPPGDVIAATGIFGTGVKSTRARQRDVLAAVRWPTDETFEKYYHPPDELRPPPMSPKVKEVEPLPPARKTISCLEQSTSPGIQSYIYWQFAQSKEKEASVNQRPWSGKPVGMFEASAIYRLSCEQLGVQEAEMINPRPIFGEHAELRTAREVGTRQCYAVAEAIRACMPKKMFLLDTVMTDMGAARIIESAVMSGRLEHLCITGTCLSYRFMTSLYNCLRMRSGNSLTEIVLRGSGIGNYLDVDPVDLPSLVSTTYVKCMSALPNGLIDVPPPDLDVQGLPDAAGTTEEVTDEAAIADTQSESRKPSKVQEKGKQDEAEHRKSKDGKAKKKKLTEEPEDIEPDAEAPEEDDAPTPEIPWWDEERGPQRAVPIALPLILHMARPGCTIRRLDLSMSALNLEMGRCIGWAVSNSQMESLVLDRCCLDDDALCALTNGLAQNRMMQELSLRGNKLSGAAEPVSGLIHIAGRHAMLAHLDFAENPIHPDCIPELEALLHYSCSVLAMHLLGPGIPGPDAKTVAVKCRNWVEANQKSEACQGSGSNEESDEEDTFGENEEELILCRARHIEALQDWRITSPMVQRRKKMAVDGEPEVVAVPFSWMPTGCWVCERCATVDFKWVVPDRGEGDESGGTGARLFVRPSFAEYSRIELQRDRSEGSKRVAFWAQVLAPPGVHSYIFESQTGDGAKMLLCARDQPSVDLASLTMKDESSHLLELCKEFAYGGRMNVLPQIKASEFKIPQHLEGDAVPTPDADPWAEDPIRQKILRECFEVDIPCVHLDEICHIEEEDEVRDTILELYGPLYDAYAMYAGRSQWPLVRQVDIYSFFEEASLLDRGPLACDGLGKTSERFNANETRSENWTSSLRRGQPHSPASRTPATLSVQSGAPASEGQTTLEDMWMDLDDGIHPLSTQDIQQMIVQTITSRKKQLKHDATWSQRRKFDVVQRTREGAPITRAQFVEVLIRAAVAFRGREPSTSAALRKFADRILAGRIMQPPLSPFPRGLALKAGPVRDTLLARRKSLRHAYERFGSNETSFQRLAQLLKLCDRSFTAKHVASIYALSRRPIKYPSSNSSTLNYDEFSEAVARLALIWQPTVGGAVTSNPGTVRPCPPQPKVGKPVNQKAVAARLEAFLERLADRMKPSVVSRF